MRILTAIMFATLAACGDAGGGDSPDLPDTIDDADATAPPDVANDNGSEILDVVAPATLTLTVTRDDFGAVPLGTTAPRATLTVSNGGGVASGPVRVDAPEADFAIDDAACTDAPLAAGASCSIDVAFTPKTRGPKSVELVVKASPGGRVTQVLRGLGVTGARLVSTPDALDFGTLALGATSDEEIVTVSNTGDVASAALDVRITGPDASRFAPRGCAGTSLAPGASCALVLTLTPGETGAMSAELVIGGLVVALSGAAVTTQLAVDPSALELAPTPIGEVGAATFTVTNRAERASGAITTRAQGSAYTIGEDRCAATSLAPGARCVVQVAFAPSLAGLANGELVVTSVASGAIRASLSGIGLGPALLTIEGPARDFATVVLGTDSELSIPIVNSGDQSSGLLAFAIAGADARDFAIVSETCPARLAVSATCNVRVRFHAAAVGVSSATFEATTSTGEYVAFALRGEAVSPDQLRVGPDAIAFAPTQVGQAVLETVTIENISGAPTGSVGIIEGGDDPDDFVLVQDCEGVLAPHAACATNIRFQPRAPGPRSATITVVASPGGISTVALSGEGEPLIELTTPAGVPLTSYDFGDAVVGSTFDPIVDVVVTNWALSTLSLVIDGHLGAPPAFAIVSSSCAPTSFITGNGGRCSVRLRFDPTSAGTRSGSLTFGIGPLGYERVTLQLSGRGVDPLTLRAHTVADFGAVPRDTTSAPLFFVVESPIGAPRSGTITVSLNGPGMSIAGDACTGTTLRGGELCQIEVSFTPPNLGPIRGLLVARATPGGSVALEIAGSGGNPLGAAPTAIKLTPATVLENLPTLTAIGTLSVTDADAGDTHAFTIIAGGDRFELAGTTVRTRVPLDYEGGATRAIVVRVTDSGGQRYEQNVLITVADVDEPTIANDDAITVPEDAASTIVNVLANDSDPEVVLTVASVTQPANGTVTIAANKRYVEYQPARDYCNDPPGTAPATFTYTLTGGVGATVAVTVGCVDDPGVAADDTATATEGGPPKALDVLFNDLDVDGGSRIASVAQPPQGTVVITGGGTGLTYQPAAYPTATSDVFAYALDSGSVGFVTVTVTITTTGCERPTAPVCVHGACADSGTVTATCDCDDAWSGPLCQDDRNECLDGNDECDGNAQCDNTVGGFACSCMQGWRGDGVTCADVDECLARPCAATGACSNTDGGWTCACATGFEPDDVTGECVDVDECADDTDGCTGTGVNCINGPGTFDCEHTVGCSDCSPIQCSSYPNGACPFSQSCDQDGFCMCSPGWEEPSGGGPCDEVDECARGLVDVPVGGICVNTQGSAHAECPAGFELDVEGTACVDVDECDASLVTCAGAHSACINTVGSAHCACVVGFGGDGTTCADIDECAAADSPCFPNGSCTNTAGAFNCGCPAGLVGTGVECGTAAASAAACGPNTVFVAGPPSRCQCMPGHVGDGVTCSVDFRSTGVDGAFAPAANTSVTLAPRTYHFTTISIAAGVRVMTSGSGVLELRATGDVTIAGTIDLSGESARKTSGFTTTGNPNPSTHHSGTGYVGVSMGWVLGGLLGGGGGFPGSGSADGGAGAGGGGWAGGGGGSTPSYPGGWGASAAQPAHSNKGGAGPGVYAGGDGIVAVIGTISGWGGGGGGIGSDAAADLPVLTTFRTGSGGGGAACHRDGYGYAGGGGGGALRIVSATKIVLTGSLFANGGSGGEQHRDDCTGSGGGSGGVIALTAPRLELHGTVTAAGGAGGTYAAAGGLGRIRLSVDPAQCVLDGSFDPPLEVACAPSPNGGTPGYTYIGPWPF